MKMFVYILVFLVIIFLSHSEVSAKMSNRIENDNFEGVLNDILSTILLNRSIFVIYDPLLYNTSIIDIITKTAFLKFNIISIADWNEILKDAKFPTEFVRGSFMVTIFMYFNSPYEIFGHLTKNVVWNPDYLILFNLNKNLNTDHIVSHRVVQRSKFIVSFEISILVNFYLVYNVKHNTFTKNRSNAETLKTIINSWNSCKFRSKHNFFQWENTNFDGAVIEVASFCDDFPFLYPIKNGECIGMSVDILNILSDKHNFTYTLEEFPKDKKWGCFEEGMWTGMLADLSYNNKTLIVNNFELTVDRNSEFDVSYPYFSEGFNFLIKLPKPLAKWRGPTYPFSLMVWILFLTWFALLSPLFSSALMVFPENRFNSSLILVRKLNTTNSEILKM